MFLLDIFVLLGSHTCIVNYKERWRPAEIRWFLRCVCSAPKLKNLQVLSDMNTLPYPYKQKVYIFSGYTKFIFIVNWLLQVFLIRLAVWLGQSQIHADGGFCFLNFFYNYCMSFFWVSNVTALVINCRFSLNHWWNKSMT